MAGATTTTLSTAIQKTFPAMVETEDQVKTPLRNFLPIVPSLSGNSYDWKVHYGGNTSSTTYSEGDAVSAAGNETYADATLASSSGYARTMVQFTGHAVDAMKGGYFQGIENELRYAIQKHLKYKEGLAITALEAALDSSGSYAGLTRATYKMETTEAAGTPTLAELITMWTTLTDDAIAMDMSQAWLLMPPDTIDLYNAVATGIAYFEFPSVVNGVVDAGKLQRMPSYNGRPIHQIVGLTSAITLCFSPETGVKLVTFREPQIEQMGKNDDSTVFSITSSEILVVENPKMAGKIT
ncbi:MAG: phage major capsid protein [Deltaproteobacteria bacterium]|nr:phage major capsid protein [Deltaproteobacteria bacterium]